MPPRRGAGHRSAAVRSPVASVTALAEPFKRFGKAEKCTAVLRILFDLFAEDCLRLGVFAGTHQSSAEPFACGQVPVGRFVVIDEVLGGDIPLDAFRHEARWNDVRSRVEMHLVATRDVDFTIAGRPFAFAEGESIHTENSHKYERRGARLLLLAGGWTPLREWEDSNADFSIVLAEAQPNRFAP